MPAPTPSASDPTLAGCPIFQELTIDEYEHVLALLTEETHPKGAVILQEGNSRQVLSIVVRGRCEVIKAGSNGDSRQLAILDPGSVFGEMSFFRPAPHSASVRALTAVGLLRLTREKYDLLHQRCPLAACKIVLSVVAVLSQRLRRMDEWTCSLVERPEGADHREEWLDFRARLYSDWQF